MAESAMRSHKRGRRGLQDAFGSVQRRLGQHPVLAIGAHQQIGFHALVAYAGNDAVSVPRNRLACAQLGRNDAVKVDCHLHRLIWLRSWGVDW